jgi:hypothetical protein
MNLHQIVSGAINTVNPFLPATIMVSSGSVTASDGTRVPTYISTPVTAQVQALSYQDMQLIEGLVINGERRAIYVNGEFNSVNRPTSEGGDLVVFADGTVYPFGTIWLVAMVTEQWPDWCRLVCTLQNNG